MLALVALAAVALLAVATGSTSAAGGGFPGQGFLPDNRAWELVSPPDKNGGDVLVQPARTRASVDCSSECAIQYVSVVGFGDDVLGHSGYVDYMARRNPDAGRWDTHATAPVQETATYFEYFQFVPGYVGSSSDDLTRGIFQAKSPVPTDDGAHPNVDTVHNLYLRDDLKTPGAGHYQLLTDASTNQDPDPDVTVESHNSPRVADATDDFSKVIIESPRNLTPDAVAAGFPNESSSSDPGIRKLYKWTAGSLSLVGQVPPPGDTTCGGGGPACVASTSVAGENTNRHGRIGNTLTDDGSRAIFTAPQGFAGFALGPIYVRDDHGTATTTDDTTVQVNASEKAVPDPAQVASYGGATTGVDAEGDRVPLQVFFTTSEALVDDDLDIGADVYRWSEDPDALGRHLTRLSIDSQPSDGSVADVEAILGSSSSGDYVYFATSGRLDGSSPTTPCNVQGTDNECEYLHVWHAGTVKEAAGFRADPNGSSHVPAARITIAPDGKTIAFLSEGTTEDLALYGHTQYDHGTACPSQGPPGCNEIYVYDATANSGGGDLRCASCNPSGAAPTGEGAYYSPEDIGELDTSQRAQGHPLTNDGRYVFFTSPERLVPEDVNGRKDAYSYDATTGEVHLLSSGKCDCDSSFLDASADGSDVFIATRERLTASDIDDAIDLYDARVGGGFSDPEVAPPPCSDSQSCRGAGSGGPAGSSNGSAGFRGPGDPQDVSAGLLRVARVKAAQRRRLARTGRLTLSVKAPKAGRIVVRWNGGRGASARGGKAATTRLTLRLSDRAGGKLRAKGSLRLRIVVSSGGSKRTLSFVVRRDS